MNFLTSLLSLFLLTWPSLALPQGPAGRYSNDTEPFFYAGHDLSSLLTVEEAGYVFRDSARNDTIRPAEDILGDGGMNTVRLRLWVDPVGGDGAHGLNYTLNLAKRLNDKGYKIYLNYHFSSTWADPGTQNIPNGWPTTLEPMLETLRDYVASTLQSFSDEGIDLAMVSLGNEIRFGMLWPFGRVDINIEPREERIANFTGFAQVYTAARNGVRDAVAAGVNEPLVMIHTDNGWNRTIQDRWFDALVGTGIVEEDDWDIFGFTIYPYYGTGATIAALDDSLTSIAQNYSKPIHVVETDWPVVCDNEGAPELSEPNIPQSVAGQLEWVGRIIDVLQGLPNRLGQGISYWEAAWATNPAVGSSCADAILFDVNGTTAYSRDSVDMFLDL
ncbi:hypothetical protein MBLNU230_g5648t1 [Neophaeotheca triangularis]